MTKLDMAFIATVIGLAGFCFALMVRVARARKRLQALRDHHESMWP